MTRAAH